MVCLKFYEYYTRFIPQARNIILAIMLYNAFIIELLAFQNIVSYEEK